MILELPAIPPNHRFEPTPVFTAVGMGKAASGMRSVSLAAVGGVHYYTAL